MCSDIFLLKLKPPILLNKLSFIFKVSKNAKEVIISVEDFAGGIPEHIR